MAQTDDSIDFLIVDDSRDVADATAEMLRLMGYQVRTAHSAAEALEAVSNAMPVCVLLDVCMPDADGLDLAREFRRLYGDDIILVAVTGFEPDDPRVAGTFAIVDHYYTKPVSPDALRRLVAG